jgi:hypothetical protein
MDRVEFEPPTSVMPSEDLPRLKLVVNSKCICHDYDASRHQEQQQQQQQQHHYQVLCASEAITSICCNIAILAEMVKNLESPLV